MNLFDYLHARAQRDDNIDFLIARTQRSLSNRTLIVIAGVLAALFLLKVDSGVRDLLLLVLGALLGGYASQNQFWYGRPRGAGVPDPSLTETKTTETKTIETKTTPEVKP
jgi:hypothetical protein